MPVNSQLRFQQNCRDLLTKLEEMQRADKKIIYLDEINFTKRSLCLREWSRKNSNLTVDQEEVYRGYKSVIASMTAENGMGCISVYPKAIKSVDFI